MADGPRPSRGTLRLSIGREKQAKVKTLCSLRDSRSWLSFLVPSARTYE